MFLILLVTFLELAQGCGKFYMTRREAAALRRSIKPVPELQLARVSSASVGERSRATLI